MTISSDSSDVFEDLGESWATEKVTLQCSDGNARWRYQIVNQDTRIGYVHDSTWVITRKCVLVTVALPFYTLANMAFHLTSGAVFTLQSWTFSFFTFLTNPNKENLQKVFTDWTYEAPVAIVKSIWACVRAPFYALAMSCCSMYGIFFPLSGRVYAGKVERAWRNIPQGISTKKSNCCTNPTKMDQIVYSLFTDRNSPHSFYLAVCFQPYWGKVPKEGDKACGRNLSSIKMTPNYRTISGSIWHAVKCYQ